MAAKAHLNPDGSMNFDDDGNLTTSEIKGKESIMDSIRDFLGKGK